MRNEAASPQMPIFAYAAGRGHGLKLVEGLVNPGAKISGRWPQRLEGPQVASHARNVSWCFRSVDVSGRMYQDRLRS